jgi:actin-binding protein IPP
MDWILQKTLERRKHIFDVLAPIRFPVISDAQMDKYLSSLGESELSIKVALQKILNDFKSERKTFGLIDSKMKSLKHHLMVPRRCARKNIYLCGGFTRLKGDRWSDAKTLNTVERYDTFYKTWHESPSFQFHRSALGAGVLEGQVCVVGGENDMLILDSVETYDPVTYEWKTLPGMTSPRSVTLY